MACRDGCCISGASDDERTGFRKLTLDADVEALELIREKPEKTDKYFVCNRCYDLRQKRE